MAMCPFNPDVSCSFHTSKSEVDGYCHPDDCVLNNCVGGLNVNELGYLDLVGFSTFLCKLSQRKSMEIITNRGKDRATHVVARMLKSAKKTVRILCSEVNLQQFDILNLSKCLKSDVSVNVLLESISDESQNLIHSLAIPNKIQIKFAGPDLVKRIKKTLGSDFNYHMMICDNNAFRLEYDDSNHEAMCSFNNPAWCSILIELFDFGFFNATKP